MRIVNVGERLVLLDAQGSQGPSGAGLVGAPSSAGSIEKS